MNLHKAATAIADGLPIAVAEAGAVTKRLSLGQTMNFCIHSDGFAPAAGGRAEEPAAIGGGCIVINPIDLRAATGLGISVSQTSPMLGAM
jgi:hypothetical protein